MTLGRSTHLTGPHTCRAESSFFYILIEEIIGTRLDVIKGPFQGSEAFPYLSETQKRDCEKSTLSQPCIHNGDFESVFQMELNQ